MHRTILGAYHALPAPARSAVATLRGVYLRRWRYGSEAGRLIREANERESWTPGDWSIWRHERLATLLQRAATEVPYYRELWSARRRAGDQRDWHRLENWPVLSKEVLRARQERFVAEDCDRRRMFVEHTSGTTGTPLRLWWSRQTVRAWYALYEARIRGWYGVSRHDHWAMIGGQPIIAPAQQKPPFWVRNLALSQLYLSANHIAPASASAYAAALRSFRPSHMVAYPSAAAWLAQNLPRCNARLMPLMIGNAEPLLEWQRDAIRATLAEEVRETYGMAEIVAAANECREGRLHLWPDVGTVEVLEPTIDRPVRPGTAGRLVCTGLLNQDMPLVRYDTGDYGAISTSDGPCPCGRRLPVLAHVDGRMDDVVITREGRRIGRLDPVFKSDFRIKEAQIIQERIDLIRVNVVPASGFDDTDRNGIIDQLRARVGQMDIVVDALDSIPRTPTGKFRAVISHVKETGA